ncbi:phosphoenolpyruvate--protein phosphotransferase [Allobranchiibius sp. CTAmp26]|uniref:phosphoenolpyruvate--protein phosphotransferase n=1 Tax=Allobranchiibius sp. CTAmp26 TaxID=2815214 RepID=UPI001AA16B4A|nr:phosphoenolpyruvate--protein phosphotransferase [Allobranchiibius sp. CTAmp26]MBO1755906.1 phosphoenolpyruvate--protein phosphotransferase [Allobranchiibius sp. CTAmp26]
MRTLSGVPVSPGSAVGPVVQVSPAITAPAAEPGPQGPEEAAASITAVERAFEDVAVGLERRAEDAPGAAKEILGAAALMARDRALLKAVTKRITDGSGPARAVEASVAEYCAMFQAAGGYLAERVTDLSDVRDRVVARLLGQPEPGIPALHGPCVLVARDLAPAETATLDATLVRGIVTEAGGRNSHTAILAAGLGIPAAVQVAGATDLEVGTVVAVDGDTGVVTVDPDQATQDTMQRKAFARRTALQAASGPGRTMDGHPVALLVNIGTAQDAISAGPMDVEGVGLFRTEVLFLGKQSAPTVEEQTQIYRSVFAAFGTRRVVVRTLDAGADKPLAFADLGEEENPALGRRGLRMGQAIPDLLDHQLEALGAAAQGTAAEVKVMAPMVATVDEAQWFAERVRAHGLPSAGVMIEIPAAALRSRDVLDVVDFGSLGTNDLAQYTMAADRMQGALSDLLDPWQPAVLDVIDAACAGARAHGKPMGVCGESGGDPLMALVLAGLGVTSLSMAPGKVDLVRYALSLHDLATCERLAAVARAARTASDGHAAVLREVDAALRDVL